ncbi:MAG: putative DNA-binding protein HU [uncultured bacterium]|nr:MAG: putative DNA-binding protein HU [uncultured bacterium]
MTTKRDIVNTISEETGLTQMEVKRVVQSTFDYVVTEMIKGGRIELRNFGVFYVKIRKARQGRNPNQPENVIPVPAKYIPVFKPGKILKERVAKALGVPGKDAKTVTPGNPE